MEKFKLDDFTKGWFIGNFSPTLSDTSDFEIALKQYIKGDKEERHYHKIATEYTAIVSGVFQMNEQIYKANDIVLVSPDEEISFQCLEDGVTAVIKIPSVKGDKYLSEIESKPAVTEKTLNIVIPMAGAGSRFQQAGYTFPKPLIEVNGKPMIQLVIENLKPQCKHKFIFICQKEHYEKYSLNEIFNNLVGRDNYECVQLAGITKGAACTVLTAIDHINNEDDLIIANSDQFIDIDFNDYINFSRGSRLDGTIMTFEATHPKWSYARIDKENNVQEVAEKKVISNKATVGIYYFSEGKKFVDAANQMIEKDITVNNEFYVCPAYNELFLNGGTAKIWDMDREKMHGLGTPEDLNLFLKKIDEGNIKTINDSNYNTSRY